MQQSSKVTVFDREAQAGPVKGDQLRSGDQVRETVALGVATPDGTATARGTVCVTVAGGVGVANGAAFLRRLPAVVWEVMALDVEVGKDGVPTAVFFIQRSLH